MRMSLGMIALFLFTTAAQAQVPTAGNVFFGYSYLDAGAPGGGGGRQNLNGWAASFEGKVLPWVGMVGDFSGHYGGAALREHNYLFGPRISFSVGKFRPFAQAMFGAGHVTAPPLGSSTSFATALGGGLDYRLLRLLAWRMQFDYVHTRFFGGKQNDARVSTGLVLRF